MYCPRCGEEQNSGNLRFCNRCGLPMGLVSQVLSNDGTLPQLEELYKKKKILTRKNGVVFSILWFILFVPFGAAMWGVLNVEELAGLSAVFGVFSSLIILLASLFFLGKPVEQSDFAAMPQTLTNNQQNLRGKETNQATLPPQQTQPANAYTSPAQGGLWKAPDTGELVTPGSVTEGTTKLLRKEEEIGQEEHTKFLDNQ